MGLDYDLKMVAFPPRFREENYLAINPLGTVPAFFDGEARMTESAAICQYLVTKYGPTALAVGPHEADYAAYLNFLVMAEATLTFPQTVVLRYTMLEPEERRVPQAAADYAQWFASRFKAAVTLMGPHYACAGRFTAADISLAYAVRLANAIGLADAVPARAQDYLAFLSERDGFKRAVAREAA
jgi:glutathione S-transferase